LSYNGSGTFVVNSAGQPVVTGTVISSTAFNALTADLATGLSTAITKDGQTTPTANIKLGGFKLTNVGTATTSGDALTFGSGTNSSSLAVPTRQNLTSGTAATYTTPANCRQLSIRMVGGGGGGAGSGTGSLGGGGNGGDTSFNAVVATHGNGAPSSQQGDGGTGGAGTANLRIKGQAGGAGLTTGAATSFGPIGGLGGSSMLGFGQSYGGAAAANSGAGGSGADGQVGTAVSSGGGGGGGEYVELIINNPAATYTYTVGVGGTAGTAGTGGNAGKAGGSGIIIVGEIY